MKITVFYIRGIFHIIRLEEKRFYHLIYIIFFYFALWEINQRLKTVKWY